MGGSAHSVPSLGVCDVYCCGSTQRLRGSWRRVAVRFSRRAQRTADDKVHRSVDQKSATVAYGSRLCVNAQVTGATRPLKGLRGTSEYAADSAKPAGPMPS